MFILLEVCMKVVLAGAGGSVGKEVLKKLSAKGADIRTYSLNPAKKKMLQEFTDDVRFGDASVPGNVKDLCKGADAVVSVLGGSVSPFSSERRSYFVTDRDSNLNILNDALRNNVSKFIYLSAHSGNGWENTAYIKAHKAVEDALSGTSMQTFCLQPTGIFSAFAEFLPVVKKYGILPVIGSGTAVTNPVHESDVADSLVEALFFSDTGSSQHRLSAIGGPEILTRREIMELLGQSSGKMVKYIRYPTFFIKTSGQLTGLFNRRLGELTAFISAVSVNDAVAPLVGTGTLRDYLNRHRDSFRG